MVGNVERNVDALTAGFETYPAATLDVMFGRYNPTGKLPITLPRGDEVLAVNAEGVCISSNDVPGYDKDRYMPETSFRSSPVIRSLGFHPICADKFSLCHK